MDSEFCFNKFDGEEKNSSTSLPSSVRNLIENINRNRLNRSYDLRRDVVLLLTDVAEKLDAKANFSLSLQNLLQLYMDANNEFIFPEAGLLLLNAAKIYSSRVEFVHSEFEKSIIANKKGTQEKVRKSRKAVPKNTFQYDELNEVEILINNIYKRIPNQKIFDQEMNLNIFDAPKNFFQQYKEYQEYDLSSKKRKRTHRNEISSLQFVHPNLWKNSRVYGLEYGDDIDTKRNYRIFVMNTEPRFNGLTNDVNLLQLFKTKPNEETNISADRTTTDLNLPLENTTNYSKSINTQYADSGIESYLDTSSLIDYNNSEKNISQAQNSLTGVTNSHHNSMNHSEFGENNRNVPVKEAFVILQDILIKNAHANNECSTVNDASNLTEGNIDESGMSNLTEGKIDQSSINILEVLEMEDENFDKDKIIVRLSIDSDEGVSCTYGELDEIDKILLSPVVVTRDIVKDFNNLIDLTKFTFTIDDDIKKIILDKRPSNHALQEINQSFVQQIFLNVLKVPLVRLKKEKYFKLPGEYKTFVSQLRKKRKSTGNEPTTRKIRKFENLNKLSQTSSLLSRNDSPDFLGFPEVELNMNNRKISTDSGIRDIIEKDLQCTMETITDISEEIQMPQDNNLLNDANLEIHNDEVAPLMEKTANQEDVSQQETSLNEKNLSKNTNIEKSTEISVPTERIELDAETEKRISDWHKYLKPILMETEKRDHFDVSTMKKDIIETFSKDDEDITFSDIIAGKDSSYKSRYFFSMLLLANSRNIHIINDNTNNERISSHNEIKLKLLDSSLSSIAPEDDIGNITYKSKFSDIALSSTPLTQKKIKKTNTNTGHLS